MSRVLLAWHGYRYFPYEREFAKQEVKALLGQTSREVPSGLVITLNGQKIDALKRLTYVRHAVLPSDKIVVTDQARLEASAWLNGKANGRTVANPGRQRTRYSAHCLHEYRGKFNPQVVRAIGNMLMVQRESWVLDPFCGSGTTLLESVHSGWNSVGIDLNPLGVLVSNAKLLAIRTWPSVLQRAAERLAKRLSRRSKGLSYDALWSEREMGVLAGAEWAQHLPNFDYLAAWFTRPVLAQFALILSEIDQGVGDSLAVIFKVILSDLVRSVSLQDPGDLRIRRRKDPQTNYPVIPMFIEALNTKISTVVKARKTLGKVSGYQEAFVWDSREPLTWLRGRLGGLHFRSFDVAITSPPYATALPYIDTQRLSLCLLGQISSKDILRLEGELIGTREINGSRRRELEELLNKSGAHPMPKSVTNLCRRMLELTSCPGNGFRRRNMPALIFQYFSEMGQVFRNVYSVMQSGGTFALVVGQNRTMLGGKPIVIDTPQLLAEVAAANGWRPRAVLELDTYQRFDMHRRNSIKTESLVLLERQ